MSKYDNPVKELFSNKRNLVKIILDLLAILIAVNLAVIFKFEEKFLEHLDDGYYASYGITYLAIYIFSKIGNRSWSYTSSIDLLKLVGMNSISMLGGFTFFALTRHPYSRSVILAIFILSCGLQSVYRLLFKMRKNYKVIFRKKTATGSRTLIYGAGEMGTYLAHEKILNPNFSYDILGYIDDDRKKLGTYIYGIKVLGGLASLIEVIERENIETVVIAMPSIDKQRIKTIVNKLKVVENINIKILPRLENMLDNESLENQIRDVSIEDLLGRDQILVNGEHIREVIENKTIFITGGAGSIGSELSRQVAKYNPKKLVNIDLNENALYFLELELKRNFPNLDIQSELASVRELDKIDMLFNRYRPEIVFHAAAHKHVPQMEHNPEEAIKNNIFGTKNVIDSADKYGVQRFVLVSTDKAVNPTNIMGATKRACELLIEDISIRSNTKFMAVRFGNVLGSNGSVIPIFEKLIKEGKNLTITHPDITRYFMTIPEAAQLVIEAGSMGNGGELFVLDMGETVKIIDLAKNMIKLSKADVGIEITGLRPGEKLYEELLYDTKSAIKTENKKIFIARLKESKVDVDRHLNILKELLKESKKEEIVAEMKKFITSYKEPEHHIL